MRSQLMRGPPLVAALGALGALLLVACSEDRAPAKTDAGTDEPPEVVYPEGLTLTWRIVDPVRRAGEDAEPGGDARTFPPVASARVCVVDHDELPCATTRSDGTFVIGGLESLVRLVLTCEKDGYIPVLRSIETASTDMDGIQSPILMGKSGDDSPDVGVPIDRDKGAVSIFAVTPSEDGGFRFAIGTKISLSPAGGDGPFFTDERNLFRKGATSMIGGLGLYFNVEEGDYTVSFEDSRFDCAPVSFPFGQFGFPAPPSSVQVKVKNGFITDQVGVLCTEKSIIARDGG